MKRYLIFTLLFVLSAQVFGQTYTPCRDCDTIPNRHRNYYYYNRLWHDTCSCYRNGLYCELEITTPIGFGGGSAAKRYTTDEPLLVKGLTALTLTAYQGSDYIDTVKLPEYLYLYQRVCPTGLNYMHLGDSCMVLLDSVRWDTVKPHYMQFKPYRDSDIYVYCYAWDAYFDKPVRVDSVFYIMGTDNTNRRPEGSTHLWQSLPTIYASFEHTSGDCAPKDWALVKEYTSPGQPQLWSDYNYPNIFGYNMAIVDNDSVAAVSHDVARGSVTEVGLIPHGRMVTIDATPEPGFRFDHWSNGSRNSRQQFAATRDTFLMAYFYHTTPTSYIVNVSANDPAMGTVSGSGTYNEGDTVRLTATPRSSQYEFVRWSDGNIDNPRELLLLSDTTLVARFRDPLGVESVEEEDGVTLSPNPAKSVFTVASIEKIAELTVVNANGVTVYHTKPDGHKAEIKVEDWAVGAYIVTVTTEKGRTTKKMIKN